MKRLLQAHSLSLEAEEMEIRPTCHEILLVEQDSGVTTETTN